MYMTPKMRNQQRLAIEMAELASALQTPQKRQRKDAESKKVDSAERETKNHTDEKTDIDDKFIMFVSAFWDIIIKEWEGVDRVRMDKFLFLIRRMLAAGFQGCKVTNSDSNKISGQKEGSNYTWNNELLARYITVLEQRPLQVKNARIPAGLALHVVDIYVDELEKVDEDCEMDEKVVLRPLRRLQKDSMVKSVRIRSKEALEDERLAKWGLDIVQTNKKDVETSQIDKVENVDNGSNEEDGWTGFDD